MSTIHIAEVLEKRIKELNERIDFKILHGRPYSTEAREHRTLLKKLKQLPRKTWLYRLSIMHLL